MQQRKLKKVNPFPGYIRIREPNKEELAKELNISVPMVNKLMRQGMPRIKIGTAVRFELVEVVKWLKERGK